MASYTAAYADIRINDDSRFRTQGQWISDTFQTMGWTKTTDTGQIDWATVTAPTVASTAQGYEIRDNGTLFFKIQYGSGYAAYAKGLWFQFGGGSDGAGNITNPYDDAIQINTSTGYTGGTARAGDDFMSGDSTRFMVGLTDDTNSGYGGGCVLEPTRDLDGDEDGYGWHFTHVENAGNDSDVQFLSSAEGINEQTYFVRLPRDISVAGVYVPIQQAVAVHPIYNIVTLRDVVAVATSRVAHQATLSVGGRTYVNIFGGTVATLFGFLSPYNMSFLLRYD